MSTPGALGWFEPSLTYDDHRFVVHGEYYWVLLRYLTGSGHARPYVATLSGASGRNLVEDSPVDHLHHHGIWWGHGDINGVDCYTELPGGDEVPDAKGSVTHEGWLDIVDEPGDRRFGFTEAVAWRDDRGGMLIDEQRRLVLRIVDGNRATLDLDSTYTAARDLTFGDTKESVLPGIRPVERLTPHGGGTITSSTGATGEQDTFGEPAAWIDVSGARTFGFLGGDVTEGIAVFDHPENPGHPQRFFTRSYGPISPFPGHHFHEDRTLGAGAVLRLRHRLLIHRGDAGEFDIAGAYDEWVTEEQARKGST